MKKHKYFRNSLIYLLLTIISSSFLYSQESDLKPSEIRKLKREKERTIEYARIDSLINSRQFVVQSETNPGSDMIFVVVDSLFGEVQNGNRRNLQGHITQFKVLKNDKKRTISVQIKMRAEISSADVFLFIGTYGNGRATIKSDFPGNFSFDGTIVDFETAQIYEGPSHFIH